MTAQCEGCAVRLRQIAAKEVLLREQEAALAELRRRVDELEVDNRRLREAAQRGGNGE